MYKKKGKKVKPMPLNKTQEELFKQNMGYIKALSTSKYYPGLLQDDIRSIGFGSLHKAVYTYNGKSKLTTHIKNVFDRDFCVFVKKQSRKKYIPNDKLCSIDETYIDMGYLLSEILGDKVPHIEEKMVYSELLDFVRKSVDTKKSTMYSLVEETIKAHSGDFGYKQFNKRFSQMGMWERIAKRSGYSSARSAWHVFNRNILPVIQNAVSNYYTI